MRYYAQINGSSVVVAVTQTAAAIDSASMIELQTFDVSVIGKTYVNGLFA